MFKDLSIGRYIETNSIIHQTDPRLKLLGILFFVTLLLIASTWQHYVVLTVYTCSMMLLTRIPLLTFFKGIRPLLKMIIFTAVFQVFFSRGSVLYWQWGPFNVSEVGLRNAGIVLVRFSLMVMMTSVIGLSTKPLDLTAGIERLLSPFKHIGFSIQDWALIISVALRFIPTLFEEGSRLKKAQASRGMHFDEGGFFERMQKFLPLVVPLFVGSFYRAHALANALDVRGYVGSAKRTKFKEMTLSIKDGIFMASLGLLGFVWLMF
ncbi:MAG: energy-coupling factor transporter transmembrane protein EcfT [Defluviitaleaceae bacterium]|nr:energy-coupling factor transporter transmembrane protein EcfT [Defluviitaleaceae bacterium]